MDNIKVAIKVRPLIEREKDECLQWSVNGNTITPLDSKRRVEAGFQFDHIFGMQKTNDVVFNTVVKPIIHSAVAGFNGTVFAYGQTGSGKTYTMMGTEIEHGIIPLAIEHMFETIEKSLGREFLIRFSYFEIYNEKINDLLDVKNTDLKIKEKSGRVFVNECSERVTNGPKHMLSVMRIGEKNRTTAETNMNDRSSRSHTIFRITIESRDITSDSDGAIQISELNLVDLAGSERASQTGATGDRFKEGTHINLSLSTLGFVIKQLSESQDKEKRNFINFRDSKLTRILQASLGGNSLTAIVCTVTPASFDETYCTLSFASRAKSIKNKPQVNEDLSDEALLKRYKKQIAELSKELEKANQTIKKNQNNNGLADRMELLKEYIVCAKKKKCLRRRSCPEKLEFENSFNLQPIIEDPSSETPKQDKIKKIKRRQSIIQSANLQLDTTTALADFEINLLESEFERDEEFLISRRPFQARVKFTGIDDIVEFNDERNFNGSYISPQDTPIKRCNCSASTSPGTPKVILRERYKALAEEHQELVENTILEKQLDKENYETLRNLKKSLDDTSNLYFDVNKKYSDLQTEHSVLKDECVMLRKQVESLSMVQERLGKIEIENKELHNKLNVALKAQKFAEDENVSNTCQLELLSNKFKTREKELESSLQDAWKFSDKTQMEQSAKEIVQLQNLVQSLTNEIEKLKTKPENEPNPIFLEMDSLKQKLEETNRLLKESDFEKSSLMERLDHLSQKMLMKTKIEEYDNLLKNFEEDKIRTLDRFDELAKELEENESGFEISTLQKAVENLSSHLTEFEQKNVNVRRKFSVFLAYIEFVCQQNSDTKFAEEHDLSMDFENWRKNVSYDEKEKSDIILELQKFRESIIRRSKSLGSRFEDDKIIDKELMKNDKETSTDELMDKICSSATETMNKKIVEISQKLEETNVNKMKLEEELIETKSKLREIVDKCNDYENVLLKLETSEAKVSELVRKLEEVEAENSKIKLDLEETSENVNAYQKEISELNSKILNFNDENLALNTNLSEALDKLKCYDGISEKLEDEQNDKLKEVELNNSLLKTQISEIDAKLEELTIKLQECEREKGEKDQEIKEIEHELKEKMQEMREKEQEKEKEIVSKNQEIKEIEQELKDKIQEMREKEQQMSEKDNKIKEKEEKIAEFVEKFNDLEQLNSELKLKLTEATENIKIHMENIDSLKAQTILETITLESKIKELEKENSEIKIQLESNNCKEFESSFCAIDSRIEEKEEEISQMNLRIKELGNENFELKSRIEDTEEKLKIYQNSMNSLTSDFELLTTKLQEKEMDLTHLKTRYKELENVNNSFAKSLRLSMNNTIEEFADVPGEEFVKSYLAANDAIKKRLEDFEKNVSIFRENVDEQKTFVEGLEKNNLTRNELQNPNKMSTPTKMDSNQSLNFDTTKNVSENDFTSIFTNESYFERMEVDETMTENETQNSILKNENEIEIQNESEDFTAPSMMINIFKSNDVPTLKRRIKDLESQHEHLEILYKDLLKEIAEKGSEELADSIERFKNDKINLEIENARLRDDVQLKIQESEEIKNGIQGLKMDIEKLEQTIYLLTTENLELTCKLNAEKEKNQNSSIVEENQMKIEKSAKREHLEKIDILEMENNKLKEQLGNKVKELDSIKECKALQYDHECVYKNTNESLKEENKALQNEITDLSDDLMKHIDESETIKHDLEVALQKLQVYEKVSTDSLDILQKKHLEAEIVELKSKVTKLENTSLNLSIVNELESPEKGKNRREQNIQCLNNKIKTQEEQIEHLTILNGKLSELKLTTCIQCSHLKELNENKRALKLEIKCLNNKLEDLQTKFQEKCSKTDALRLKASEEVNMSLNESNCEGMSITLMEENILHLSNEKETLKVEYEKLSTLFQEPNTCSDPEVNSPSLSPVSSKKERILRVESAIKAIGEDLQQHKEKLSKLSGELEKYKELEDKLKSAHQALKSLQEISSTAEEKVKILENEIATLYKTIEESNASTKFLQTEKLKIEVDLQIAQDESANAKKKLESLKMIHANLKGEKNGLEAQLEIAKEEKEQLLRYEDSNRQQMESTLKENQNNIEQLESNIREITARLNQVLQENQFLIEQKENSSKVKNLEKEELESAKKLIIKETMSLTPKCEDLNKTVSDLFENFLKTILSKEHEVMTSFKDNFDKEKRKLVEAAQQSEDAEKRANTWAKSLETDIEKMQSDVSHLEGKNLELEKQIERMEKQLNDNEHENQCLREKYQNLKVDYNNLQMEFEKTVQIKNKKDDDAIKEKIQASVKSREIEFQSKMKEDKEDYNRKLGELTNVLKNLETQNIDLKSNVEGLEANEKQLKNIIDIKTEELIKSNQEIKELYAEIENLTEVNKQITLTNFEGKEQIEKITSLLKDKCDKLSEYKTKVETLMPEYDHLKNQLEERRQNVQKYKEEIEGQKIQHAQEINLLRDKLEEEEIKSVGLVKQLEELNNKNVLSFQELEAMRTKCSEMEVSYEKLMRKVRNSTSKHRAEQEVEDVMDKNRTLEKNLEGASNRISELMEAKNKAMKDVIDLQAQLEIVKRDNEELKTVKSRHHDLIEFRVKHEELLQEKNKIKLELEEKKLILSQKDKRIEELTKESNEKREKIDELENEAEELAQKIQQDDGEITRLEDKLYNIEQNLKFSLQTNTELRVEIESLKQSNINFVQRENELKCKIIEMEHKLESKSSASSRSTSPIFEIEKRKNRRSDLYNKQRNIEELIDSGMSSNCQCSELRKTISEQGQTIALKDAYIATLNIQIQSENFPHEKKCRVLQDELTLQKNKCRKLQQEYSNLKKKMLDKSSQECKVCKDWRQNQRHQGVQCEIKEKIYLSGTSSGIVAEHLRMERLEADNTRMKQQIDKIEKEKDLMKKLCRHRNTQIRELQSQLEAARQNQ